MASLTRPEGPLFAACRFGWFVMHGQIVLTYALSLLCIGLHMAYIARIGGDHFEYRPLVVQAAVGIGHLGTGLAAVGAVAPGCGVAICCKNLDIRAGSVSASGVTVDPSNLSCDLLAACSKGKTSVGCG